ncbi:MAG: hypothetical protein UV80_C0009G0009 [Candidatus Peregrinibacteria bacterium GW2011_GWF2_43_17]|nr:MAG: hypothetical protein UV80_C0009G0009 [Candidatus Peregrinibacteria bacterium GW2011_GWF2_43_17]KKT20634.1 MAG: hypothetical protein UW03_C0001G0004 [Candidatus Peregrinibacteria bacterium GW2011_GWA2_43_8]HAU39323.1 hypothetical protein [Candidatus Peregrinibacteria bacterium]
MKWIAPEYVKHKKGPVWATVAISLTAALIAYAILTSSWTMAVAFSVLAIVYYLEYRQDPKDIEIEISEFGIRVADKTYPFSHMRAFWIIYEPPFVKTLHVRFAKKHMADLIIQLADYDPVEVRKTLLTQLPEWEGKEENFLDMLVRAFKL